MLKISASNLLLFLLLLLPARGQSQQLAGKIQTAFQAFRQDPQLRNAISSLCVMDARTGAVIFEHNSRIGLVPASTQKVITGISAYELLGKDFRYKTRFAWHKEKASLQIMSSGDPTFGSWRWPATGESTQLQALVQAMKKAGITTVVELQVTDGGWGSSTLPDGWLWQDVGNYYGAGAAPFNWRENQYDVILKSGQRLGEPVIIVKTEPKLEGFALKSEVITGAAGSGDSAYIYFPLQGAVGTIRGTIPMKRNAFEISGAMPNPPVQFAAALHNALAGAGMKGTAAAVVAGAANKSAAGYSVFHAVSSPPLDSMMFWFNRKSVNLYGEAFVKTIGYEKTGTGSTDKGIAVIKSFWHQRGIPAGELNMVDGSGLSPLNRVTTHALVSSLQYAGKQPWFKGFYHSLPLLNGMKTKSGTMRGVKGFAGYHRDKAGNEYVFAFVVNNYAGTSATVTRKMYRVLDALK